MQSRPPLRAVVVGSSFAELAAICVLDAGNNGIVFKADHVLAPNGGAGHARVMAGPQAHWAKLAFERYFFASRKRGLVTV
jgi:sulfide:quinone oxidoreductase